MQSLFKIRLIYFFFPDPSLLSRACRTQAHTRGGEPEPVYKSSTPLPPRPSPPPSRSRSPCFVLFLFCCVVLCRVLTFPRASFYSGRQGAAGWASLEGLLFFRTRPEASPGQPCRHAPPPADSAQRHWLSPILSPQPLACKLVVPLSLLPAPGQGNKFLRFKGWGCEACVTGWGSPCAAAQGKLRGTLFWKDVMSPTPARGSGIRST